MASAAWWTVNRDACGVSRVAAAHFRNDVRDVGVGEAFERVVRADAADHAIDEDRRVILMMDGWVPRGKLPYRRANVRDDEWDRHGGVSG